MKVFTRSPVKGESGREVEEKEDEKLEDEREDGREKATFEGEVEEPEAGAEVRQVRLEGGRVKVKKRKAKKLAPAVKEDQWFELSGVNFSMESERDRYLAEFQSMLSSCAPGMLYVRSEPVVVEFEGSVYTTSDVRFYLRSPSSVNFFSARPVSNPLEDRPAVLSEYVDHVATEKDYARVFLASRWPAFLPEGFLFSVIGLASEIVVKWWKIPANRIISSLESSMSRKRAIGGLKESLEIQNIAEMARRLREGQDVLTLVLYLVVRGRTREELNRLSNRLREVTKSYGVEVHSPRFYQGPLYDFADRLPFLGVNFFGVRKTIADSFSVRALFPLIKESLVDEGGVFLGFSGTGDPVVFNPYRRTNYLMLVLGESGSGKSFSSKVYMSRLHARTGLPVYGVDPESEYTRVAGFFGSSRVEVREGEPLGLDPLKAGLDRVLAAEALGEIYSVPKQLRNRLRKELYSTGARSVLEFAETCDPELRKYLEPITAPPDRFVFEGNPPDFSRPTIFGMKEIRSEHLKLLTTSLVSVYLLQSLSSHSVVFVDEGWLFVRAPRLMAVFENLARRGRKHGVHFLFITQRVEDVASTPEGRTLLEQAATVLLMGQEREGADLLRSIYKLSQEEVEALVRAEPGEGLLKVESSKIFLRVAPTSWEFEAFSTTPLRAF